MANEISINLLISDNDLRRVLDDQSMYNSPLSVQKGTTGEEELRILRRRLQDVMHPPPVFSVISRIIAKKPVYLECFKSIEDKEELLDEAIQSGCGDAMLTVFYPIHTLLQFAIIYTIFVIIDNFIPDSYVR